jgi:hypothetical protein
MLKIFEFSFSFYFTFSLNYDEDTPIKPLNLDERTGNVRNLENSEVKTISITKSQ